MVENGEQTISKRTVILAQPLQPGSWDLCSQHLVRSSGRQLFMNTLDSLLMLDVTHRLGYDFAARTLFCVVTGS